jgi:hypothetical protein
MLSRIAENQNDADAILELLNGFVDTSTPSEELETLARGFANSPPHARSIAFLKSLPEAIRKRGLFARASGAIYFNAGDLKKAEDAFRLAVSGEPSNLAAHLGLMDTLIRLDRKKDAHEHLERLSPRSLEGAPIHKMRLSQLLVSFELRELGLQVAYETAVQHQNEPEIIQIYIGMGLLSDAFGGLRSEGAGIQVDDWVELVREGSVARQAFVIEHSSSFTLGENLPPTDTLARQLIGRPDGAEIAIMPSVGTEQIWRISAHKHKYLALLEKLMIVAATRFSDAIGFHQFEIKGADLTPILAQTRLLTEQSDELFDLYETKGIPIAVISALSGKTTPEVAAEIVRRGQIVRTCIGNERERNLAFRLIRDFDRRGIVLDTIVALIAHEFN